MKKDKKLLMLSIIGILSLILITVGVTYAFFNYAKEGATDNTITTGSITFLYTEIGEVGRGISLEDAYPVSDSVGKAQTGEGKVFDFKVTSSISNNSSISYEVTARRKDTSDLSEDAVKLYLTKVTGTSEEEVILSKYSKLTTTDKVDSSKYNEKTLYKGKVPANTTDYEQAFKLRMWIDESTDFSTGSMNDKEFTVTVNVYANAKVITEEEAELESNNDILSINVDNKKAVTPYSDSYDYEIGLASGTKEANLDVITVSEDTSVKLEKLDSLAYGSNVKRLSNMKSVDLTEGDNYFKITTTSLTGEEKESTINVRVGEYKESLLNGTDPVLSDNLVPVIIKDNGEVYKVDNTYMWYDYETKYWANAIVLKDTTISYNVGDNIPESNIESYFVWIPRYKYKLFNLENYSSLTTIGSSAQTIEVVFENKDTAVSSGTTVGSYLTHPAFVSFDSNGFWVGKFETGYNGATSTEGAQVSSGGVGDIVIKPNVYSWRNITLGNIFKLGYDYLRKDDSHMMKNTEWGAVVYLHHSIYGSATSLRINNNSSYITGYAGTEEPTKGYNNGTSVTGNRVEGTSLGVDGTYTVNYLNSNSVVASTTGNITGVYDMSGGAYEYVAGYTTGASTVGGSSGITSIYSDFFTNSSWSKYYDKYSSTTVTNFNKRILGDATGEIGPFGSRTDPDGITRNKSSWYGDAVYFPPSSSPWFRRSGGWYSGSGSGAFMFDNNTGGVNNSIGFRIVLTP